MFILTEQKITRNKSILENRLYNIFLLDHLIRWIFRVKEFSIFFFLDYVKWAIDRYKNPSGVPNLPFMYCWNNRIKWEPIVRQHSHKKVTFKWVDETGEIMIKQKETIQDKWSHSGLYFIIPKHTTTIPHPPLKT